MFRALISAALPAFAAETPDPPIPPPAQALTLERVFASPALDGPMPREVRLSPDGQHLTLLRNRPDDRERYDLWGFNRTTGQWRMLVDSQKLTSGRELSEVEKMQRERKRVGSLKGILTYEWAPDAQSLLVPLDGDLFIAGLDGSVRQVAGTQGGELNPKLGPKGRHLAYVRDRRLWVCPVGTNGTATVLTPEEASEDVRWGEAEFVAQEEMNRYAGFWWSPDESRIAVERFDESRVGVVTRAAIGANGTRTYNQRYPMAGGTNAEVSLWIVSPTNDLRVAVDLGPDRDIYLARVDWAPDGRILYVQRENRAQTRLDLLAVDPDSGRSRVLWTEQAAQGGWINLSDRYRFLEDGSLIWWSERDGFGHLYRYRDGTWQSLTRGEWVVTALLGVDEAKGRLYFTGTRDSVLAQQVYALSLAAPDRVERLTDPEFDHSATMDKQGRTLLITRSSPDQPPQSYLADGEGRRLAWIEENRVDESHPYAPYRSAHRPAIFGTLPAVDGTPLHWCMVTPPLEPGRRYPVFYHHYGGPGAQLVRRGWQGSLVQAIVARGYIYFELDNRGSEHRGVRFASSLSRAMGSVEVQDQLAGAGYLKTLEFVDPKRIATFGWSYGGYLTLKMLEANPGVYAAGIAVAPVTRWELYDTHYTERFLGDPNQEGEVYSRSGALAEAAKIRDPLLIIHGMADDNVVFENSSAIIATLQADAVPFEMMLYPGYTHGISGPRISQHLYETVFRFLARNGVGPGPVSGGP
ncbi:MAG: DPP IV N-terminal domain-containing protein [Verrucomicrobiales bacterium]|nr:DPP IV N-terminal domain-containing protein [Verrucomicrobiales bacterium]